MFNSSFWKGKSGVVTQIYGLKFDILMLMCILFFGDLISGKMQSLYSQYDFSDLHISINDEVPNFIEMYQNCFMDVNFSDFLLL
jgi:hypothetical protein